MSASPLATPVFTVAAPASAPTGPAIPPAAAISVAPTVSAPATASAVMFAAAPAATSRPPRSAASRRAQGILPLAGGLFGRGFAMMQVALDTGRSLAQRTPPPSRSATALVRRSTHVTTISDSPSKSPPKQRQAHSDTPTRPERPPRGDLQGPHGSPPTKVPASRDLPEDANETTAVRRHLTFAHQPAVAEPQQESLQVEEDTDMLPPSSDSADDEPTTPTTGRADSLPSFSDEPDVSPPRVGTRRRREPYHPLQ